MSDDESHPDRLLSEPAEALPQHERTGSMSIGALPTGDGVSPLNPDSENDNLVTPVAVDPSLKIVNDVVNSEIGVSTLLNRLKQSIASAKEFALFLKKRSALETEHANGIKKICSHSAESMRKPEQRHGSFLQSYEEITQVHERMAENGSQFASSLSLMHDDLQDLVINTDRSRKHWKANGLANEQRVAEAEANMRKLKAKYDALAEDYDRARTGDRQSSKKFGLKGPKSAAQHEADLLTKVQQADSSYAAQVKQVSAQRDELWTKLRPEAVKTLQELIKEIDSATTLQMQKFASYNEKLLLSNALNVSPLPGKEQGKQRSLRQAVAAIDNDRDFSNYISSFAGKVPARVAEIKYERNPVLNPPAVHQPMATPPSQRLSDPAASYSSRQQGAPQNFSATQAFGARGVPDQSPNHVSQPLTSGPPAAQQHERSVSHGQPLLQGFGGAYGGSDGMRGGNTGSIGMSQSRGPNGNAGFNTGSSGPPQISTLPFQTQTANVPTPTLSLHQPPPAQSSYPQSPVVASPNQLPPPLKPVFGLSLEQLFERDGSAVPMVVYQCIIAVDMFGLEVEGIYRLSGTQSHVAKIKAMFDNDASKLDFRNPENFFHDVNSVAGLLKQFFRDLPDPLLTAEHYQGFIDSAKNEDDIVRRDSLHAIINSLPDPNYATLRAVTLHLKRVIDNSSSNRMNASNLAIVFGPTLMGTNASTDINDAGWQVRVIDTILNNTYQIFDDD